MLPLDECELKGLFGAGHYREAESKARECVQQQPDSGVAWKFLALALVLQGKEGLQAMLKAAELLPLDPEVHNNLGNALRAQGRHEAAAASCRRALQIRPDFAEAHSNLGSALRELGELDEAASSYCLALQAKPNLAEAHSGLGNVLLEKGLPQPAVDSYRRALEINPLHVQAHTNMGNALLELEQYEAAEASLRRALQIRPRHAEAHSNLGNVLLKTGRYDAALEHCRHALQIKPSLAQALNNSGYALWSLGDLDRATANFDEAITLHPAFADAYVNRAMVDLLRGDFERGWRDYEWRRRLRTVDANRPYAGQPWLGEEPLGGKRVLVHAEQGLGDTLQFCRYALLLAERGAQVTLEVQRPLRRLLGQLRAGVQVIARGQALPPFDYHCPLLSLPLALGTTPGSIPFANRYLHSEPPKVSHWQTRLGTRGKARVGVVWSGRAAAGRNAGRSVPLEQLLRYLPREFEYFSLQKEVQESDLTTLQRNPWVRHVGSELLDFSDTAALCDCVDLVVTVDTSVAHMSAALGKPTWLLLSWMPDWRWLLDRTDSPWYPTMRLFRQQIRDDWEAPLVRVQQHLYAMLATDGDPA